MVLLGPTALTTPPEMPIEINMLLRSPRLRQVERFVLRNKMSECVSLFDRPVQNQIAGRADVAAVKQHPSRPALCAGHRG